ncbi:hypothetical protein [Streptomyces sp. Wb2n-11]|uniref:hypothetical protein n=1 Tax=Streptomyces sp. Wb2n-11 TaxID=1030533 RepID=UPI000AF0809F|nr:hypothetical protein [Streptomyces sp. Wb2n-11]
MAIADSDIAAVLDAYLERYPQEAGQLAEPLRLLAEGRGFASRRTFPMHVTAGALLVRDGAEILLIEHLAYGITLQTGVRAGSKKTSVSMPTCSGRSDVQVPPHRRRTGISAELLKSRSHSCNLTVCVGIQESPHPRAAHGWTGHRSRA